MNIEKARSLLHANLTKDYGEDGYKILELYNRGPHFDAGIQINGQSYIYHVDRQNGAVTLVDSPDQDDTTSST